MSLDINLVSSDSDSHQRMCIVQHLPPKLPHHPQFLNILFGLHFNLILVHALQFFCRQPCIVIIRFYYLFGHCSHLAYCVRPQRTSVFKCVFFNTFIFYFVGEFVDGPEFFKANLIAKPIWR